MKVNTVAIEYSRKFNLGDWESVTIGVHMWASPDEEEDPEAVTMHLFDEAKKHVRANIPSSYAPFKPSISSK
jgi:hypothetical protein